MSKYLTAPVKSKNLPGGIPYIIGNEAAERFSFYGMRTLLVVFMTTYLMQPGGALDVFSEEDAKKYFHLFIASAYFTPILGGILSDAWLGKYRTILCLSLVYCAGHACLAFMGVLGDTKAWLLIGLVLVAIGSGGIKPCVSAHVGDQFGKSNSHWLSKVYGWFYLSINLGAFLSGLITPWLQRAKAGPEVHPMITMLVGEKAEGEILFGTHWAFGLPGVLMALATLMFWLGRHKFIHVQPPKKASSYFKQTFSKEGVAAIARVSVIFAFIPLFWSLFDQMGSTWIFQAQELNRITPKWVPLFGGKEILPEQINGVFNPLFILILIPVFNYVIYPAIDKVFPLTALRKMGIGFFVMAVGFGIIAVVNMALDAGSTPHIGWQVLGCAIVTAAEVMISITGLEFAYTQAPRYMKSFVLSLFLLTVSFGNFVTAGFTHLITDSNGQAVLGRTEELWFWTGMILLTGLIFIPVAMRYKVQEYLQEEEDLVVEPHG